MVLVTDGYPTECEPTDISVIAALAEAATAWTPPVRTHVIGLDGVANMKSIAERGNGETILVEGGNVERQLLAGMLSMITAPIPCQIEIDVEGLAAEQQKVDRVRARVFIRDPAGVETLLSRLKGATECSLLSYADPGGWYLDDPVYPSSVHLCESTCGSLGASSVTFEASCVEGVAP